MPKKAKAKRKRKSQRGGDLKSFLSSANNFLKKNKIISRGANIASVLGVPYAGTVGGVAGALGYGKPKTPHGHGKRDRYGSYVMAGSGASCKF